MVDPCQVSDISNDTSLCMYCTLFQGSVWYTAFLHPVWVASLLNSLCFCCCSLVSHTLDSHSKAQEAG